MQPISFHYDFENSLLKWNKYIEGHFVINSVDYVMWLSVPIKSEIRTNYGTNRRLLFYVTFLYSLFGYFFLLFCFLKKAF